MRPKNKVSAIPFPDSHDDMTLEGISESDVLDRASPEDVPVSRVLLVSEVLFHREALTRALCAYDDIALVCSVADVHAALVLAEEKSVDVLVVDSPSEAVASALAAHPLECKVVFIGALGNASRQSQSLATIFVGASSSLEEVHVALRFGKHKSAAPKSRSSLAEGLAACGDAILTGREQQVSHLLAGGYSNKEIAEAFGISIATVKNHVHRVLGKLNIRRRAQIARLTNEPRSRVPSKPLASSEFGKTLSLVTRSRPRV